MGFTLIKAKIEDNMTVNDPISDSVKKLALGSAATLLKDDEVFIRSHLGRIEIQNPSAAIPRRLRTMLLLVDGKRCLADYRNSMTRYRNLDESIDMLFKMGLIERLPEPINWHEGT
jgi:hypothetical protein